MPLKKLFVLVFFITMLISLSANAQTPTSLSSVRVFLWPEFDRPALLVIYSLTLPANSSFPMDIDFRLPIEADAPHAVAARQPDGSLVNLSYDQKVEGDWLKIHFKATTPELQLEYYDPRLGKDGLSRHFIYSWPGDFSVDNFQIEVQQPSGATQMRIKPGMGNGATKSDGLVYYSYNAGAIPLFQEVAVTVDYQKPTDELTYANTPVEPIAPLSTTTDNWTSWFQQPLFLIIGIMGVLLIAFGVGGFLYYEYSLKNQPEKTARRRHKTNNQHVPSIATQENHIYCHQCGNRAAPGDHFCRACGTQLRAS